MKRNVILMYHKDVWKKEGLQESHDHEEDGNMWIKRKGNTCLEVGLEVGELGGGPKASHVHMWVNHEKVCHKVKH